MDVNTQLLNRAKQHMVYLRRYDAGLAERIVEILNQADADKVALLGSRLAAEKSRGYDRGPATTKRIEKLIADYQYLNTNVYNNAYSALADDMVELANLEAEWASATLKQAIVVDLPVAAVSPSVLRDLALNSPVNGHILKPWFREADAYQVSRVESVIRTGLIDGHTIDQMVKSIAGPKGILDKSRASAKAIAVTATTTVTNRARLETYRENSDIVGKVRFVATLDGRTSDECAYLDGKVYRVDEPHPTPALHPHCRSILTPVTKSWRELGIDRDDLPPRARASMNGQVPGDTTYRDWLPKQPRGFIEDYLGKERADLLISGKLKFDDFFDNTGKRYNLAELRKREGL